MKNKKFIAALIIIIVTAVIAIGSLVNTSVKYNDGFCPNCRTHYDEKHYVYDGKEWIYYNCKDCGKNDIVLAMIA